MQILAHSEFPFVPILCGVGSFFFVLTFWSSWWAIKCTRSTHTKWLFWPLVILTLISLVPLVLIALLFIRESTY